jgi:hypothetical protein
MRAQAPLVAVANRVFQLARAQRMAGYVAIALGGEGTNKILLYWHGDVPGALAQALRAPQGNIRIELHQVPYSLATLDHEARRIIGSDRRVREAGPLPDFTGLDIGVDPSAMSNGAVTIASTVRTVVHAAPPLQPAVFRWDDIAPFWGGAAIRRSIFGGYNYCTTSFAATPNGGGTTVMLSAYHCGTNKTWQTGNGTRTYGTSDAGNRGLDAMRLTVSGGYGPAVYIGPYNSASGIGVAGTNPTFINSYTCYSGSWSGEVCANQIKQINQYVDFGDGPIGPGQWTELAAPNDAAVGPGDSGGPMYIYVESNQRIRAEGSITGIDISPGFVAKCRGLADPDGKRSGRPCSRRAFSVDINAILPQFGLQILTSP